jgi:micrococcal nuclease
MYTTSRDKTIFLFFTVIFLYSVFLCSSVHITYGTIFENVKLSLSKDIYYNHLVVGFKNDVTQIINQTATEGVELVGNVTYVVDGDTLEINGIRVRLSLVDTPERGQPGFKEAKEFVSSLCLGNKAELDVDDGQRRGDRYGREIGIVYCNGVNINEKLMKGGFARIIPEYCDISEFSEESWASISCSVT